LAKTELGELHCVETWADLTANSDMSRPQ